MKTDTAFAIYLTFLAALYVRAIDVAVHAYYTVSLAVLTTSAFFILVGDALIPSADSEEETPTLTIILYLVASALAMTTPRGPPLHFPRENIYSATVLDSARPEAHDSHNVNELTSKRPPVFTSP
jgi:hypothetical protein